jgi:hypothetical protein
MAADHVVDEFSDDHGLTDAGSAKQTGFSPPLQGHQKIDGFNPRVENFFFCDPAGQGNRLPVHRVESHVIGLGLSVNGLPKQIEHSS